MREPNTELAIMLCYPRSNRDADEANLEITDRRSGITLVDVTLTPEAFMQMIHATGIWAAGWVTPPEQRERIGRQIIVQELAVPPMVTPTYVANGAYDTSAAEGWMRAFEPMWPDCSLRHGNRGWRLVMRRWE